MTKRKSEVLSNFLPRLRQRRGWSASLSILVGILLVSMPVFAAAPMPDIPKGKGDKCVEDTQFMRESHMNLLLHQRDDTLRRGIRTKKHSLMECLDCHVVKDSNNQPVSAASPKHFCRTCHDYASVNIDCFDCHASKPAKKSASIGAGATNKSPLGFGYAGLGTAKADPTKLGSKL